METAGAAGEHGASLRFQIGPTVLTVVRGDITLQEVDAIVNAANSSLMGGGGVDGAIHRAGGPKILEECMAIVARQGECPTGEAVITGGGSLKARYVIHTVGPVWYGGTGGEERLLANAYANSLRLAVQNGIRTIAFPSISTGVYHFPVGRAARIALETVINFVEKDHSLSEVRFIVFSKNDYRVYAEVFPIASP
jgi:O-acetyl-ADP-ribose deacetylase (regulator of RNase III)